VGVIVRYNALYNEEQLILGEGRVVVVTGWTPKEKVAGKLDNTSYAAVGNLYSATRGISFLIRNLLANPWIGYLCLLKATHHDAVAGSVECLHDFFKYGVRSGDGKWIINSEIEGFIDGCIPLADLQALRLNLPVRMFKSVADLKNANVTVNCGHGSLRKVYPDAEVKTDVYPGQLYGNRITASSIAETWVKILHLIRRTGVVGVSSRGGKWQELIDIVSVIDGEDCEKFPIDDYLHVTPEFIENYIPQICSDNSKSDDHSNHTYGQRLRSWFGRDQIEDVVNNLVYDPLTNRAVMVLWDVTNDSANPSPPCLNHIWCRIIDNSLTMTAIFRSNDMFSAWVANAMGLRALQAHILEEITKRSFLQLEMGALVIISESAHIYEECWDDADAVVRNHYSGIIRREYASYDDPVGNFIISRDKSSHLLLVSQTTPGSGEVVHSYSGLNPLVIIRNIHRDNPGINPVHLGYIGIELHSALSDLNYVQDIKGNSCYVK